MSLNAIQFQSGLSWQESHRQYGSEAQCDACCEHCCSPHLCHYAPCGLLR